MGRRGEWVIVQRRRVLVGLFGLPIAHQARSQPRSATSEITRIVVSGLHQDHGMQWSQSFHRFSTRVYTVGLALEHSVDTLGLEVHGPIAPERVQVGWRFETSLTLQDDGAHLDLSDWLHGYSSWQPVLPTEGKAFLLPIPSPDPAQLPFPPVTLAQVRHVVAQRPDAQRWLALLPSRLRGPAPPLQVALSAVGWRVQALERHGWQDVQHIDVTLPLGC